ncbi:unnamed protein product [Mortierella alpina]
MPIKRRIKKISVDTFAPAPPSCPCCPLPSACPADAMGAFDEEDEDDDFAPSTPHTIRVRNALPPKSPGIKRPAPNSSLLPQSSQQQTQQKQQKQQHQRTKERSKQLSQPGQTAVHQEPTRQQTHSEHGTSFSSRPVHPDREVAPHSHLENQWRPRAPLLTQESDQQPLLL